MKRIKITEATDQQLRDHVETVLQLDVSGLNTRAKITARLGEAQPNDDTVLVADDAPVPGQTEAAKIDAPTAQRVVGEIDYGPIVYLKIMQTDSPGGKDPAQPNVNGHKLTINRNVLVGIPYAHYEALKHSYNGQPSGGFEGDESTAITFLHSTNYPLSEITLPPQAEVDAWLKATGPRELGGKVKVAA